MRGSRRKNRRGQQMSTHECDEVSDSEKRDENKSVSSNTELERMINNAVMAAVERTMKAMERTTNAGGLPTTATRQVMSTDEQTATAGRLENNADVSTFEFRSPTSPEHHHWGNAAGLIPDFDPIASPQQTIETWINRVEQAALVYGWTEKATINVALPKLKGVARTWFEGLASTPHSWSGWKDLLREWFPTAKSSPRLHREMEQRIRRPGENVESYFHDKLAKARLCGLSDTAVIDYLITGLDDEKLIMALSVREYESPQHLLRLIKQTEDRLELIHDNRSKVFTGSNKKKMFQSDLPRRVDVQREDTRGVNRNSDRRKPRVNENGEYLCFNCSEYGHLSRNCPKPQRKERCTICQRTGHKATDCKLKTNKSAQDTTPTISHVDKTNEKSNSNDKYFKEATINDVKVKAYLDLGSKCVTMRKTTADELGLSIEHIQPGCIIRGYGAGHTKPIGTTTASICVDQVQAEVKIFVVSDDVQTIPLLIGQPFTELPEVTIVKRKNTLRLFRESQHSEDEDECLRHLHVPELPPPTVNLWAQEATVIPPNYVGFVDLYVKERIFANSDVFVDVQMRAQCGLEHCIPRSVTMINSEGCTVLPICNVSNRELTIREGQRVARATRCTECSDASPKEVMRLEEAQCKPLPIEAINVGKQATKDELQELHSLINEYRDCFAENLQELGRTSAASMKIELTSTQPVTYRPYRLSHSERELVRGKISELLTAGIIVESDSPYASPILIVKKKSGEERLCIDYRALNKITKRDRFPLPIIEDQLERLQGNSVFTGLDMASGYYQIPVSKESQDKTAFITPDGHYQFCTMPFGLTNAPAVFQRMINSVLGPLRYTIAMAYMDDILIPSATVRQGLDHLRQVLEVLRGAGLTLNLKKCYFFQEQLDYLGFEISREGVRPGRRKIDCVQNFPRPTNVHEVRRFIGLASYFRRFVKGFATEAEPLTRLLRKGETWRWDEEQEGSFQRLKTLLIGRPILGLFDFNARTEVHTDASQLGLGAMLLQEDEEGRLRPVQYASRQTTKEERRYHSSELETLAIVWALERFRAHLIGKHFTIVTDCNSVRNTLGKRDLVPRVGRWWIKLQEFDYDIEHRPGTKMCHVDALSRAPFDEPEETDAADGLEVLKTEITDEDWLVTVQHSDSRIQEIKEQLTKNDNLTADDKRVREEYSSKNGVLFKRDKDARGNEKLLWVVPHRARWRIVKRCHDDIGHFAVDKTLAKVREHFWFPRMKRYIRRYISSCLDCLYHKRPAGRKQGELHSIDKIGEPFHTLHVDHLGPFVRSTSGNTYLIVLVDGFTKFTLLRAVRNAGMKLAARFVQDVVGIFGAPRRIISDQGTAYTGKDFETLCRAAGIQHVKNATATPRGNGQVERYNRTITPSLAAMCKREDERDWDVHVRQVQWGINNTIHKATGRTPFSLLFNYLSRHPDGDPVVTAVQETFDPEVLERRRTAMKAILHDQQKQRARYNARRAKATTFEPGDLVVVEREPTATGAPRKTATKYKGPYIVTKKLASDRYQIEDLPEIQRTQRFYRNIAPVDKLKRWYIMDNENDSELSSESSDDEHPDVHRDLNRVG